MCVSMHQVETEDAQEAREGCHHAKGPSRRPERYRERREHGAHDGQQLPEGTVIHDS